MSNHYERSKKMMKLYPKIKELETYDPKSCLYSVFLILVQLLITCYIDQMNLISYIIVLYFVGATINHILGLAIHESSHNLVFKSRYANIIFSFVVNLPMIFPIAASFRRYHNVHHNYLGVKDGKNKDTDLFLEWEINNINNKIKKIIWISLYFFVYIFRGLTFIKMVNVYEVINIIFQSIFVFVMYNNVGIGSVIYLSLCTIIGYGLHPTAGHFLQEHLVMKNEQETNSYYGNLNLLLFNVGYHTEHHDFPRIPCSLLPKLKIIAPEFYNDRYSDDHWTSFFFKFIMDDNITLSQRKMRTYSE